MIRRDRIEAVRHDHRLQQYAAWWDRQRRGDAVAAIAQAAGVTEAEVVAGIAAIEALHAATAGPLPELIRPLVVDQFGLLLQPGDRVRAAGVGGTVRTVQAAGVEIEADRPGSDGAQRWRVRTVASPAHRAQMAHEVERLGPRVPAFPF